MVRRSLAVANGDTPTLGSWETSVNARFWCTMLQPPEVRVVLRNRASLQRCRKLPVLNAPLGAG